MILNKYIERYLDFENKVVLVSGASGQLGSMLCESFKLLGAKVIGWDLNEPLERINGVTYLSVDISNKRSVSEQMKRSFNLYGRVDILINNAGVSTFEPFEKRSEEDFDWVVDVNLKGTFLCIQSFIEHFDLLNMGWGNIINIASFYGVISPDYRIYNDGDRKNSEVYGASKAGVIQMTRYFAVHLAKRNIRVNAISPGGIFNPKNPQSNEFIHNYIYRCPMGRMANTEEIIGAAIYFSSTASSYTTGQNLIIDGGMSSW